MRPLSRRAVFSGLEQAAARLREEAGRLAFLPPTAYVYNPLDYAWAPHRLYLERCAAARGGVIFVGMNPGPFGMAQTGVPFGEVRAVREWMGIEAAVGRPAHEHPKRPVWGFACPRSEVSGKRLWGLMAARFGAAEAFFRGHAVVNYCPLAFFTESGANRTPDKLPVSEKRPLLEICDHHLREVMEILQPRACVGLGQFAFGRLAALGCKAILIPHPSPASPAANRGWEALATRALEEAGIW